MFGQLARAMHNEEVKKEKETKKVVNAILAEIAARVAHEVNRAYCEHIGDDTQKPWKEAEQWERDSAHMGVRVLMENPDLTPAQQHSMWVAHKKKEGWRYGKEKDEKEKAHPCIVPFDELPEEQKLKDALFQASVKAVLGVMRG